MKCEVRWGKVKNCRIPKSRTICSPKSGNCIHYIVKTLVRNMKSDCFAYIFPLIPHDSQTYIDYREPELTNKWRRYLNQNSKVIFLLKWLCEIFTSLTTNSWLVLATTSCIINEKPDLIDLFFFAIFSSVFLGLPLDLQIYYKFVYTRDRFVAASLFGIFILIASIVLLFPVTNWWQALHSKLFIECF